MQQLFNPSAHCADRQRSRHITPTELDFAVRLGTRIVAGNAIHYFVRRKDVPQSLPSGLCKSIQGLHVVVGHDGTIITLYREYPSKAFSRLRKRAS